MLPFKSLTSNDVTDVADFPTSYINYACLPIHHPHPCLRAKKDWRRQGKANQAIASQCQPLQTFF
jgi:hypothetical protein